MKTPARRAYIVTGTYMLAGTPTDDQLVEVRGSVWAYDPAGAVALVAQIVTGGLTNAFPWDLTVSDCDGSATRTWHQGWPAREE